MADEPIVNAVPPELQYKAQLMDVLYQDPKMRPKLLALVKEYAPNLRIPEIDTSNEVMTALTPHLKEIGEHKRALAEERAAIKAERQREKLSAKDGITDEDWPEIDKLMKDGGVSNLETAAELHRHRKEAARPRGVAPSPFTLPGDASVTKEYLKDPVGTARKRAYEVVAELRRG